MEDFSREICSSGSRCTKTLPMLQLLRFSLPEADSLSTPQKKIQVIFPKQPEALQMHMMAYKVTQQDVFCINNFFLIALQNYHEVLNLLSF